MFVTILSSLILGSSPVNSNPVTLARSFSLGDKLAYKVTASLRAEARQGSLDTFMPENVDFAYGFTTEVKKLKSDGIVEVFYSRPTFTMEQDEDTDSGPVKKVEKVDMNAILTLSPINQILEVKDLTPPKKKKVDDEMTQPTHENTAQAAEFGSFIGELHRLALFMGSFDSALDFNPKLPLDKVAIGDTWKQTVSYQPQKIKGDKEGKQEVERLDYVFTYKGPAMSNGKSIQRVQATLTLDTDLGDFFNQISDMKPEESHLKKIPMNFKATIDFDLDAKTLRTLKATAHSEGGFQIWITDFPDRPIAEEKFKGDTTETLVGVSTTKK